MKKICALFVSLALAIGLLPAAAIAAENGEEPFSASAGGAVLIVGKSEELYSYTVYGYDGLLECDLYEVTVPADAGDVTLDFGEEQRLAYGYDANGNYVAAYGEYGDGRTGQTTATVSNLPDFVRVQTPYDEAWNSELLYAVSFQILGSEPELPDTPSDSTVSVEALLEKISAGYVDNSSEWIVMDMAAYADKNPGARSVTSDSAKQAYIDAAIASVSEDGAGESAYAKAILCLQSIGADPQKLYPESASVSISAVDGLKNIASHSSSAWVAPYTLAAFNQGDYGTEEQEQAILSAVLANQAADGSWSEWGDSIQTTANMIAGLAFYYDTDESVAAAVDKAVAYLSSVQKSAGSFDAYGSGADANTAAMVVVGLCAVGIDPDTDERFIKNENSVLDALLAFAVADNSGFGYMDNSSASAYSTEQGFRALVAASAVMESGKGCNIYDFSDNEVAPAYAGGEPSGGENGGSRDENPSEDDTITVSFTLKTHQTTWIKKHNVTVDEDATVADVFYQVLDGREGFDYVDENGYVSSITWGGTTWSQFGAGRNSGWKYKINGAAPNVGMRERYLEDGDEIVWYYVTDYTQDSTPDEDSGGGTSAEQTAAETAMSFTDVDGHWAENAIRYVYERELMQGTGEGVFSPDRTTSRGMIVTILYRLEGSPAVSGDLTFADVAEELYCADAVKWAVSNGIAAGYSESAFGPNDPITRAQLAVILYRYAGLKGYDVAARADLSAFADADKIGAWAQNALEWANAEGLVNGRKNNLLDPQGNATRAQTAVILMRYLERVSA